LPGLNTSMVRSSHFRPLYSIAYWFLVVTFILLGWLGQKPVEDPFIGVGLVATLFYFFIILVLFPILGIIENKILKI
jgi:ubiquinol-cytochrome c reductase cytochrome b subunit